MGMSRRLFWGLAAASSLLSNTQNAWAQRAADNAVAEAADAFGTQVGREQIGLYSAGNARGFSPSQAGNLRVEGLYFDMVGMPNAAARVFRGSAVHVGISAQGYAFPAPTGVVDFNLRRPGEEYAAGGLLGATAYGQRYGELDVQGPVVKDVLSVGGGFGYSRHSFYRFATTSEEWNAGAIADWRISDGLRITPFWAMSRIRETGSKTQTFVGSAGYPTYRSIELPAQPWGRLEIHNDTAGVTTQFMGASDWRMSAGLFWSRSGRPTTDETFLFNLDDRGDGDYAVSLSPARFNESVSGELKVSRRFNTQKTTNTVYANFKGRNRTNEFGGSVRQSIGRANLLRIPIISNNPVLSVGAVGTIQARQATLGLGYEGAWKDVGQVTVGLQQSAYRRTIEAPGLAVVSGRDHPLVYNIGAAAYATRRLAAYASYTSGFEETANAPPNSMNRDEAVPAQITKQLDAGLRYGITQRLNLVMGVFRIEKPYYNLDSGNLYRRLGSIAHRGLELSLAGKFTDEVTLVAGATYLDPKVKSDSGGTSVAVGPVPLLVRVDAQYRAPWIQGLTFEGRIERLSSRYTTPNQAVELPAVTTLDVGFRYSLVIFQKSVTVRLQGLNLTDKYALRVQSSGSIEPFEARRVELSVALDM